MSEPFELREALMWPLIWEPVDVALSKAGKAFTLSQIVFSVVLNLHTLCNLKITAHTHTPQDIIKIIMSDQEAWKTCSCVISWGEEKIVEEQLVLNF